MTGIKSKIYLFELIQTRIAPTKVAIIPIGNDDEVLEVCNVFKQKLDEEEISNYIDLSDKTLNREGIKQINKDEDNEELRYSVRSILKYIP